MMLAAVAVFIAAITIAWLAAHPRFGQFLQTRLLNFKPLLECRFPRTVVEPGELITGLIILGGHTSRVEAAANILVEHPEARVIFSGQRYNEQALSTKLTISQAQLSIDRQATNTYENAVFSKELANPEPGERWLLVTSALHMPRSIGTFRAQDFSVEAWPVDDAHPSPHITAPVILHELVGLAAYFAMGRTDALFPGIASAANSPPNLSVHKVTSDSLRRSCAAGDRPRAIVSNEEQDLKKNH